MEFEYGDVGKAIEFLKGCLGKKVAIFSHTDVDGFVAARIVNEGIPAEITDFMEYGPDLVARMIPSVVKERIEKVILTDLNVHQNASDLNTLSEHAQVLVVDHHEYTTDLNSKKIVFLKAPTKYCAGYAAYQIMSEAGFDVEKYDWMAAAAIVSDFTFNDNRDFVSRIEEKYRCKVRAQEDGQAYDTDIGEFVKILNNAIVYFHKDRKQLYAPFKGIKSLKDVSSIQEYADVVEKEIVMNINRFEKEHETVGDMWYSSIKSEYPITSVISTAASRSHPDKTIVFITDVPARDFLKISTRRNDGKVNLQMMLEKVITGLEGASTGGHFKAAGATIQRKDLDEVKRRLFEYAKEMQAKA